MKDKIKRWDSNSSLTLRNTSDLNSIEEDEFDSIERSSSESSLVDDEKR